LIAIIGGIFIIASIVGIILFLLRRDDHQSVDNGTIVMHLLPTVNVLQPVYLGASMTSNNHYGVLPNINEQAYGESSFSNLE
jgi:nitrate reductase gamma subunit